MGHAKIWALFSTFDDLEGNIENTLLLRGWWYEKPAISELRKYCGWGGAIVLRKHGKTLHRPYTYYLKRLSEGVQV